MRALLLVVLLAACEKTGGVETSTGSAAPTTTAAPVIIKPDQNTTPKDAAVAASPDAAAPPDAAQPRPRPRPSDADLEEAERVANILSVASDDNAGDLSKHAPSAELARQIEEVKNGGRNVVIGGGRTGGTRTTGGPGSVATPTGRVSISSKQAFDESSLTVDEVLRKVMNAYMTGIKRCYTSYLEMDPSARGKLKLSFTVNEAGRVVSPQARGFASEIDDCIEGRMATWIFKRPLDKDDEATEARFGIDLQLVPN